MYKQAIDILKNRIDSMNNQDDKKHESFKLAGLICDILKLQK